MGHPQCYFRSAAPQEQCRVGRGGKERGRPEGTMGQPGVHLSCSSRLPVTNTLEQRRQQIVVPGLSAEAEGGLSGHGEEEQGKEGSARQDHTRSSAQSRATICHHFTCDSETDRHSFSKAQARQMSQSIKKILMKLNHRGSC